MKNEAAMYQAMMEAERKAAENGLVAAAGMRKLIALGPQAILSGSLARSAQERCQARAIDHATEAAHYALLAMELSDELYGTK